MLVLSGEGYARVKPQQAQRTGSLEVKPQPRLQSHPLPELETTFSQGYLRLSPQDDDPTALHQAQALHQQKLPRYLSSGAKVRLPVAGVRVIELATKQGDLLILDSPQQTAVYRLSS